MNDPTPDDVITLSIEERILEGEPLADRLAATSAHTVILDLSQVEYIRGAARGVLIRFHRQDDRRLVLRHLTPNVQEKFANLTLDRLFHIE